MAAVFDLTRARTALVPVAVNAALVAVLAAGRAEAVLALAVLAPVAVAVVNRPQRGVLLLAALVPFNGLLLILPAPPLASAWKEALVVATLLSTFVAPASARGSPDRRLPGWAPGAIGLLMLAAASAVPVGGLQAAVGLKVLFFYLLVAVVVWRCPLDERERDQLVTILMVTGVVTSLVGLGQQLVGPDRLNQLGYEYNTTIRSTGGFLRSFSTFNQPFGFAFFVMLSLIVGIPQAFSEPARPRNRFFLVMLPVLGLGLASSFVRGAWIGLAVGLAYLGFSRHRALLLLLPLAVVSVPLLPGDLTATALSGRSSGQRVTSWAERVVQLRDNPAGAGIGATGSASEKVAAIRDRADTYQPDNYYFKIGLELGVVGLWLQVLLLAAAFGSCRAAAAVLPGRDGELALGSAAMVLAAAAASVVATYFEIFPMDVYFWLLLTVVATCRPASR